MTDDVQGRAGVSDPPPIPPGWYADPDGGPYSRWWDGNEWSSHEPMPQGLGIRTSTTGVDARTVWIWFVALLPLLGLGVLLYDYQNLFDVMRQLPTATRFSPLEIFTPGYFAATLLPLLGNVGTIVFSAVDSRALRARGVERPFHWAWSFFVLVQSYGAAVYPIGRTIVARRRGARTSWVPMAVAVVVQAIVLVATTLWTLHIMSQMISLMSSFPTVGSS